MADNLLSFGTIRLKLKFVDIDKYTLNYDLVALAEAVSEKTRLIMAVNLLGNSNEFNAIKKIIGKKNIILIEDNCESMGASFDGRYTGTFGVMGSFSTFFSHHMSTMEGGMVITDDEELYHILICLRAHGWTRNLPKLNHVCGEKSDDPFEESFRFVLPGYNVRPIEMEAAIGVQQLKKLPKFLRVRRDNAKVFVNAFRNHSDFYIQREIGRSSWFGFSLILKEEYKSQRKDVLQKLTEAGVECRPIVAGNFCKNKVMQYFNYEISGTLENADLIDKRGFFIGNSHEPLTNNIQLLLKILQ